MSEFIKFKHNINSMDGFAKLNKGISSSIVGMINSRALSVSSDPEMYFQAMWSLAYIERVKGNFAESHSIAIRMQKEAKISGFEMPNEMMAEYKAIEAYSMAAIMICDPYKSSLDYTDGLCRINEEFKQSQGSYIPDIDKAVAMSLFAESRNELVSQAGRDFAMSKAKEMMVVLINTNQDFMRLDEMNENLPVNKVIGTDWIEFVSLVYASVSPANLSSYLSIRKH